MKFVLYFLQYKCKTCSVVTDHCHPISKFSGSFSNLFFLSSNTFDIISSFMGLIAGSDRQPPPCCQNQAGDFIKLTVIVKCINRSMTSKS